MTSHGVEMKLVFGHSLLSAVLDLRHKQQRSHDLSHESHVIPHLFPGLQEEDEDGGGQEEGSQDSGCAVD